MPDDIVKDKDIVIDDDEIIDDDKKSTPDKTKKTGDNEPRMYSEEEVQKKVQKRLKNLKDKMPSEEDMKAFKEWKNRDKTGDQKLEDVTSELNSLKSELKQERIEKSLVKNEVAPDFMELVMFKAAKEEIEPKDMDLFLEELKESNPNYFKAENKNKIVNAGGKVSNKSDGDNHLDGVEKAFYARNPHLKK